MLDKTQKDIKERYYWVDLPKILKMKSQEKARILLDDIQVSQFPHITDTKTRKEIINALNKQLPQHKKEHKEYKSPEDQYETLKKRKGLI